MVIDALPNSLIDSIVSPKVKMSEKEGIGVRSLACSTLRVRRACWSSGIGTRISDMRVNYSYELA